MCITGPRAPGSAGLDAASSRRLQQVHSQGYAAGQDNTGPEIPECVTSVSGPRLDPAHHPHVPGPQLPGSPCTNRPAPQPWVALLWVTLGLPHQATHGTQDSLCHIPQGDESFVCTEDDLHSAAAVWPCRVALLCGPGNLSVAVSFVPLTCAAGRTTPHPQDCSEAQGSGGSLPACAPEPQGSVQSHGARPSPNPGQAPPRTSLRSIVTCGQG